MVWYKSWFDSPLYDQLYKHRDDNEAVLLNKLIVSTYPPDSYPTVLDLACGRGRHSIHLAKNGYRVTGMDLSAEAIESAQNRAVEEKLDIKFLTGDMREPLLQRFNMVVNLFTSFGYFDQDQENILVFKAVQSMLHTGGAFVMDYLNPTYVRSTLKPLESGQIEEFEYEIRRSIQSGTVFKEIIFKNKQTGAQQQFTEQVKLYDLHWLSDNLQALGFRVEQMYGEYSGVEFDSKTSSRTIMFCSRD